MWGLQFFLFSDPGMRSCHQSNRQSYHLLPSSMPKAVMKTTAVFLLLHCIYIVQKSDRSLFTLVCFKPSAASPFCLRKFFCFRTCIRHACQHRLHLVQVNVGKPPCPCPLVSTAPQHSLLSPIKTFRHTVSMSKKDILVT